MKTLSDLPIKPLDLLLHLIRTQDVEIVSTENRHLVGRRLGTP